MKKFAQKYLALVLTFALVIAIPFAFTQDASAKSKGSKVYVPTKVMYTWNNGYNVGSETTTYGYDKNGNNVETVNVDEDYTSVVERTFDKKGNVETWKRYNKNGALTNEGKNTIKKGKIIVSDNYYVVDGKSEISSETVYTYKKGKVSVEKTTYTDGSTSTAAYRSNGKLASIVSVDGGNTYVRRYDKKGNIVSAIDVYSNGTSETWSYTNTYKKGKLKTVAAKYTDEKGVTTDQYTSVYYYKKGKVAKDIRTSAPEKDGSYGVTTTVYTYGKGGVININSKDVYYDYNYGPSTYESNTAIVYQKVKANSKNKKAVKKFAKDFQENYVG